MDVLALHARTLPQHSLDQYNKLKLKLIIHPCANL